ncbi:ATP-binding protein [Candidatus Caldarchaeum subterraneum]|uniref:ATP-binding protein n=1 Tax=Caldiarchaeum subterraneum TaxID=311458 RepID=E6N738_CALS0|nr:ATP-binding protein [Candidatus Caldarchaeum subterraneum]BAJ50890.1 ATP-binding protein [Candidatus Caldarchaeum subterraneum]
MRLAALFSGGKDSTYAIYLAENMGHVVEVLLTFLPQSIDSYLFHYPNIHLTPLQAEAMGRHHIIYPVAGMDEEEALKRALSEVAGRVDGVVAGALASSYQRERMKRAAEKHGFTVLTPLWGQNPGELLRQMLRNRFEIMVVAVAAAGMDRSWLGRILDEEAVKELEALSERHGVNPAGEGGEMETMVLDCPLFRKRIKPLEKSVVWRGVYGYLRIERAVLVDKNV